MCLWLSQSLILTMLSSHYCLFPCPHCFGVVFFASKLLTCSWSGIARCQICSSISSESRTMLPQHYARCHPAAFTHTFDVIFFQSMENPQFLLLPPHCLPLSYPIKASSATCKRFFQIVALPTVSLYIVCRKRKWNNWHLFSYFWLAELWASSAPTHFCLMSESLMP